MIFSFVLFSHCDNFGFVLGWAKSLRLLRIFPLRFPLSHYLRMITMTKPSSKSIQNKMTLFLEILKNNTIIWFRETCWDNSSVIISFNQRRVQSSIYIITRNWCYLVQPRTKTWRWMVTKKDLNQHDTVHADSMWICFSWICKARFSDIEIVY